MTELDVF